MGTGQGQGGQQGGMMGQMPQGGLASLMGGMPPGMGGPMPQQGGQMPPGMAAPGGAQFSAMNFTPRPATMGLDGMPIQRANDPQMLAQMQARLGGQMPQGGPGMGRPGFSGPKPSPAMMGGQMPQGGPGMGRPISPSVPSTMQRGLPQGVAGMFRGFR
jgi:hypothetical protein